MPGPGAVVDYKRRGEKGNKLTRDKEKRNCSSGGGEMEIKEREHRWTTAMKDFGRQLLS